MESELVRLLDGVNECGVLALVLIGGLFTLWRTYAGTVQTLLERRNGKG